MKSIPGNSRIFLVGSGESISIALKKKLEKQGHNVMLGCDCHKLFNEVITYDPHVILVDISTPTEQTAKFLRKLRRSDKTKDTSLIFISNLDTSSPRTLRTVNRLYSTQLYFVKSAWTLSALLKRVNRELTKHLHLSN